MGICRNQSTMGDHGNKHLKFWRSSLPVFDPLERADEIKKIVCHGDERKYYRFRSARYYGGIASADCVGCNLDCAYCWSYKPRHNPRMGKFYSPAAVAGRLSTIARQHGYRQVRITGNEPTICREHLIEVISLLPSPRFILETNGILIDDQYVEALQFPNLHVRVSLKGANGEQFSRITGARPEFFERQLDALRYLIDGGVACNSLLYISR